MLADFYIPRLSNDMKIAVQKNHLESQILYRSLVSSKKTASKTKKCFRNIGWHYIRSLLFFLCCDLEKFVFLRVFRSTTKMIIFSENLHKNMSTNFWRFLCKTGHVIFWKTPPKNWWMKSEILVRNRNFGQKSKFWSKIEILVKNRDCVQKLGFLVKVGIFCENRLF